MTRLADVVNFNADASCLAAATWLDALAGGEDSRMCRWLRSFVEHERRVTLGIVGATVAEMAVLNPESIALINRDPEIFEPILRPFSHDIALLRSPEGFASNRELGQAVIESEFDRVTPYWLPPEFMLTNEQLGELARSGAAGTFINAARFSEAVAARIPRRPYRLTGLFGATLDCLPVEPALTEAYLTALHAWEASAWNETLLERSEESLCGWRDGESWLFVPDGLARENAWLAGESRDVERVFVRDLALDCKFEDPCLGNPGACASYPVHPFSDWVGEFRMFGFLRRLGEVERRLPALSLEERLCWLQAANSDVLSAVEKASPRVAIETRPPGDPARETVDWEIRRSGRGFEGEEALAIAERHAASEDVRRYVAQSAAPHVAKLRARLSWFSVERRAALALDALPSEVFE